MAPASPLADRTSLALLRNAALLALVLAALTYPLERRKAAPATRSAQAAGWAFLVPPASVHAASKRHAELFALVVAGVWIASVPVVLVTQAYEYWGPWGYLLYCGSCASLYLVLPYVRPADVDRTTPWHARYITKANLWIGIFGFIGNYWYTHYFYRVLRAKYTFDAHRLNDVPISMFLMTHAYFMFYHVLSNFAIRYVHVHYVPTAARFAFSCALVAVMAYVTAVMEAVTIATFPYYSFEDRHSALVVGSAFYGIYFLASFPMFYSVDEPDHDASTAAQRKPVPWTLQRTAASSLAAGMAVLCGLDFARLAFTRVELFARV